MTPRYITSTLLLLYQCLLLLSVLLVTYIKSYTLATGFWNIPSFFLLWSFYVCLCIGLNTLPPNSSLSSSCSSFRRLFPDGHTHRGWFSAFLCLFPLSLLLVSFVTFLISCNHFIFLVYFLSLLNLSSIRTWIFHSYISSI